MGKHNFLKKAALATLIVAPLLITAPTLAPTAHAYETNPNGYEVPDLTGYKKIDVSWLDVDEDGLKETIFTIYQNSQGEYIINFNTKGHIWAWGQFRNRNDKNAYVIVDGNCDGIYERVYDGNEELSLPQCLK